MQRLGGDASSIIRTPRTHGGKRLCLPAGAHRELRCTHARMHARTHKWQPRVRPDWDPRLEASCSAKCERGQTRFCHPEPRWQNRVWLRAAQASASAGVVVQRAITGAHSLEYADPQCAGERAPHVPSPRHPLHPAQHYRCCGLILAGLSNITIPLYMCLLKQKRPVCGHFRGEPDLDVTCRSDDVNTAHRRRRASICVSALQRAAGWAAEV
jgi:hypothetical protein